MLQHHQMSQLLDAVVGDVDTHEELPQSNVEVQCLRLCAQAIDQGQT